MGTSLLKDINPGALSSGSSPKIWSNGTNLFLRANDGTTTSGTGKYLTHVQGHVFFRTGDNLRRTDGTAAGTVSIQSSTKPTELTEVNGTLFYAAEQSSTGRELWKVSGVSESLVKNINNNAGSSNPVELTNVQGTLFFSATNCADGIDTDINGNGGIGDGQVPVG